MTAITKTAHTCLLIPHVLILSYALSRACPAAGHATGQRAQPPARSLQSEETKAWHLSFSTSKRPRIFSFSWAFEVWAINGKNTSTTLSMNIYWDSTFNTEPFEKWISKENPSFAAIDLKNISYECTCARNMMPCSLLFVLGEIMDLASVIFTGWTVLAKPSPGPDSTFILASSLLVPVNFPQDVSGTHNSW